MPEINLIVADKNNVYFSISYDEDFFCTGSEIANFLNLSLNNYNDILINKVIQHNYYRVNQQEDMTLYKDIIFALNGRENKDYLERFKDAFSPQLTLFALGGE